MIKLEKIILVLSVILTFSCSLFSQTFKVSQNIISASVFQPITTEGGYTLSFERMIDPGYSRNIAQFSYKMNITLISKTKKSEYLRLDSQVFYDEDAYRYSGFSILPEIKYYFTWNAPIGIYMNIFGSYMDYNYSYTDIRISNEISEEITFLKIGRGIGTGFQFKLYKELTLDIVAGYHLQNIKSKTKLLGNDKFIDNSDEIDEKIYMNIHFGISF